MEYGKLQVTQITALLQDGKKLISLTPGGNLEICEQRITNRGQCTTRNDASFF